MNSSLRDRYRLGLQKLADGSASNNAGGSPAGKSGIKGVDSEQDSGQARGEKGNKEQDTEAPEDGGNVGLEPTHSKEPRDIRQVFEHVNASIESQSEEAAEPGTPPLPVVLPPMIPEDNDIVGAPGALIATIPGARDIFNQYTAAGTPPEQAVLEVLDELHLSGKSQELTTAQQYLAKQVADMLGWQEPAPAPQEGVAPGDPQAQQQNPQAVPPGQEGQPAVAALPGQPTERIIKKETIKERPVLKRPEAEKVSFDVDALLKVAHDRVQEMDDLYYRLLKETPVWEGPDRGVAYGRYLKTGAEKIDKEEWKKRKIQKVHDVNEGKKPGNWFTRGMLGSMGAGMAASNLPIVGAGLKRRPTLWHGTGSDAAQSILNNPDPNMRGIQTRFAGIKGRANSSLLSNAVLRELERGGAKMTEENIVQLYDSIQNELTSPGRRGSTKDILVRNLKGMLRGQGQSADQIKATITKFEPTLSELGMRTYWGVHPSGVIGWASDGAEMAAKANSDKALAMSRGAQRIAKFRASMVDPTKPKRMLGYGIANALSFGTPDAVLDGAQRALFRPDETLKMTRAEASEYIKSRGPKAQVVLGGRGVPLKMDYMKDFPGLRGALAFNPGLKQNLRQVMPNFDPGKDISMPADMPETALKEVRVVNPSTGRHTRIRLTDYKKPKVPWGVRAGNLKRLALPTIAGLAGLDLAQASLRGRHTVTSNVLSGKELRRTRKQNYRARRAMRKTASKALIPVRSLMAPLAMGTAGALVPGALVSSAVARKMDKGIDRVDPRSRAAATAAAATRDTAAGLSGVAAAALGTAAGLTVATTKNPLRSVGRGAVAAGRGLSAGKGRRSEALSMSVLEDVMSGKIKPRDDWKIRARLAGVGAYGALTTAPNFGAMGAKVREGTPPEMVDPMSAPLYQIPAYKKLLKKHPETVMLPQAALMSAIPAGAAYSWRKYYPGHFAKTLRKLSSDENKDYHRTQNLFLAETMGGLGTAMAGPRVARATHQGVLNLKSLRLARPRIRAEKEIADINKGMASAHDMPFDQARKHVKKLLSERAIPENKLALIQRKLDALKKSQQSLRPKAYTLGGKKMFSAGRYGALAPAGLLAALHGATGLAATNDAKKDREHVRALQSTSKSMKDLARVQRLRYEREQKLK